MRLQFERLQGVEYTFGKVLSRPFQRYITSPQNPKISVGKPKKQSCSRLADAEQAGQKNRNRKMSAILFLLGILV